MKVKTGGKEGNKALKNGKPQRYDHYEQTQLGEMVYTYSQLYDVIVTWAFLLYCATAMLEQKHFMVLQSNFSLLSLLCKNSRWAVKKMLGIAHFFR